MPIERIQAPSGGINTDASPDYVNNNQAQGLVNMLPYGPGKVAIRGAVAVSVTGMTGTGLRPDAFWAFDNVAHVLGNPGGGTKLWYVDVPAATKTDVTAVAGTTPDNSQHARYGAYVYGETTGGILSRWDGFASALAAVPIGPAAFLDLQVFANRLFILGGASPGTTTPVINSNRVLYWTDPGAVLTSAAATGVAATDIITSAAHGYANGTQIVFSSVTGGAGLSANQVYYVITATTNTFQVALTAGGAAVNFTTDLTASTVWRASWHDDVSGLINQIQYDGDDTPVALAGCGRFMAILGTRSINILTGSGTSNFAVRNLSRNWGCTDLQSVVEVDDGFYFMSDRGYCFCDGSSISVVSSQSITNDLVRFAGTTTAATFGRGYIAVSQYLPDNSTCVCWLYNIHAQAWTQVSMAIGSSVPVGVYRTNEYPILWQSGGLRVANNVTTPLAVLTPDYDGASTTNIAASWTSHLVRLASPGQVATIQRVFFDYKWFNDSAGTADANAWRVRVLDQAGTTLLDQTVTSQTSARRRSRFQVECFAECDAAQILVTNANTGAGTTLGAEIYDAYIEYAVSQNRSSS